MTQFYIEVIHIHINFFLALQCILCCVIIREFNEIDELNAESQNGSTFTTLSMQNISERSHETQNEIFRIESIAEGQTEGKASSVYAAVKHQFMLTDNRHKLPKTQYKIFVISPVDPENKLK